MNERSLQILFGRVVLLMPMVATSAGCGGATSGDEPTGMEGGRGGEGFGGTGNGGASGESNGGTTTFGGASSGGATTGGVGAGGATTGGVGTGGATTGGVGAGGATTGGAGTGGATTGGVGTGGATTGGVGGASNCRIPAVANCPIPHAGTVPSSCVEGGLTATLCTAICGSLLGGSVCQILSESEGMVTIECPPACVAGRRPPGWKEREVASTGLGAYWARVAELESASVAAFRGLRAELRALGAPRSLLRALSRAARDERRHTRATSALSRRFGARPLEARPSPSPARSLEAIALDNVSEGCVRELYGALVATYQAQAAREPHVRAVMGRIAREETRHAALSLTVQRWLERRLDPGARARVSAAKLRAARELRRELTSQVETPGAELAGLPSRADRKRLFDSISDVLSS